MSHPRILGIGTANPTVRLTQEQSFHAAGYQGERVRKIFLNSDIDHRHFYLEARLNREESSDQLNQRYLRGAVTTGCRAILNCIEAAGTTVHDVEDFSKTEITRGGEKIMVTRKEFKTVEFLTKNAQRVISRDELLDKVWGNRHGYVNA